MIRKEICLKEKKEKRFIRKDSLRQDRIKIQHLHLKPVENIRAFQ